MKTLGDLLNNLEALEVRGDLGTLVEGVAYDSRRVVQGQVFVAVSGVRQDGTLYVADAIRRGACAVVGEKVPHEAALTPFVRVADSRKALALISANFYDHPAQHLQLIGITGTNGKTTTTLLLESILKQGGCAPAVLGTLFYRWGGRQRTASMTTPESLDLQKLFHEMRQDGVSHVVMEVSSHALALGRVDGCLFRIGLFTNLSQDHLDFHGTMESYFHAKSLLFREHLSPNGRIAVGVVNGDDPYGARLIQMMAGEVWSYSLSNQDAHVWVRNAELTSHGIRAQLQTPRGSLAIHSPLMGRLNLYNLLAAATAALALGIPRELISKGLEMVCCVDGRLQRVEIPSECGVEVVVDYAHTPDAMEKALSCLKEMTQGRLLVVFGCGGDRDKGKRPLMGQVAARWGDVVILTSDNPRSEIPEAIIADIEPGVRSEGFSFAEPGDLMSVRKGFTVVVDRKRAIELALLCAGPGDMIFIGGKGHETYQIVGGDVHPFDDRIVVRDFMARSKRECR